MNVQPIWDRLIVRKLNNESKTGAGIFLPEEANQGHHRGEVLAAGPGQITNEGNVVPMSVKEGDIVIFPEGSTKEMTIDGENVHVMSENSVIGVVHE